MPQCVCVYLIVRPSQTFQYIGGIVLDMCNFRHKVVLEFQSALSQTHGQQNSFTYHVFLIRLLVTKTDLFSVLKTVAKIL